MKKQKLTTDQIEEKRLLKEMVKVSGSIADYCKRLLMAVAPTKKD